MSRHPLIQRSTEKEVRQAKGFRVAAEQLGGEQLAADYAAEKSGAPNRSDAGKKHLVAPNKRLAAEPKAGREGEHAAIALVAWRAGESPQIELPDDGGHFEALHPGAVLKSAPADKANGEADPNWGIDKLDCVGIGPDDRLACVITKVLPADATRVGTGDTPLRALLEGLAHTAVADANRSALEAELEPLAGRPFSDAPPVLILLGSPRYWELCRKREAQKGAAWIREMERLAAEIQEACGVTVLYCSLRVKGDPPLDYASGSPVFTTPPRFVEAWEPGAGRIKPKPKPRARKTKTEPSDEPVEADLSRPIRDYATTEHFVAGDRIQHPTLGLGIVQGLAGPGKIRVHFDERRSVLVHDRPGGAA